MILPALLVAGVVGTIVTGLIVTHRRHTRERIAALREEAARLNLTFSDADAHLPERLEHFQIFKRGRRRSCKNVMRGRTTDLDIVLFDYQYTTGGGKDATTHRLTIVLFDAHNEHIPTFSLRPEHLFHKLGQVFGYHDIDFDSHPGFSKQYLLRGPNEESIRGVFREHVLDYFQDHPGMSIETSAGQLIYYPTRKRIAAQDLEGFLTEAVTVYALITT